MKNDDLIDLTRQKLTWLRLPGMAAGLQDLLELANDEGLSALEVASRLADEEKASRIRSAVRRRIRDARFPEVNTIDGFDFGFDPVRKKTPHPIPRFTTWPSSTKASARSSSATPEPARPSWRERSPTRPVRPPSVSSSYPRQK